jgi:parvulin-like peptidyl-prolyl isomerase
MRLSQTCLCLVVLSAMVLPWHSAVAKAEDTAAKVDYFAIVDGEHISKQEFRMAYQAGMRKRFYHGKIPQAQLDSFKQEVSDTLIERVLLIQEAKRRKIQFDPSEVKSQLNDYEARYSKRPNWETHKEAILEGLTAALQEENTLTQLRRSVQNVPEPSDKAVKAFYEKRKDLFTTPEQSKVSLILLSVAPSSTADVWQAAYDEANQLVKRLKKGSDFAEMARIHSGDPSASKGGDMGFLHQGMLAPQAEKVITKMSVGDVSEPVMLLRGVAIFRLDEKQEAKLNSFAQVKERAVQLLKREQAKQAWSDLLRNLKAQADIKVDMAGL